MKESVSRRAKKGQAFFQIRDFQDYLNDVLLPQWRVPRTELGLDTAMVHSPGWYLRIFEATDIIWVHNLGLHYTKKRKSYYVDRHNHTDVLKHRGKWLLEEAKLELRQ